MTLPSQTLPDYLLRWPRLESLCQQVKKLLQAFFIINGLPQPVNGNRPTAARPRIRSPSPVPCIALWFGGLFPQAAGGAPVRLAP